MAVKYAGELSSWAPISSRGRQGMGLAEEAMPRPYRVGCRAPHAHPTLKLAQPGAPAAAAALWGCGWSLPPAPHHAPRSSSHEHPAARGPAAEQAGGRRAGGWWLACRSGMVASSGMLRGAHPCGCMPGGKRARARRHAAACGCDSQSIRNSGQVPAHAHPTATTHHRHHAPRAAGTPQTGLGTDPQSGHGRW